MASRCCSYPHLNNFSRLLGARTTGCRLQHPSRLSFIDWKQRYYSIKIPSSSAPFSSITKPSQVSSPTPQLSLGCTPPRQKRYTSNNTTILNRIHPSNHPSTTSITHSNTTDDETHDKHTTTQPKMTGQECYDRAIQAIQTKRTQEDEAEEAAAKEQYDAMEQSFRRSHNRDATTTATRTEGEGVRIDAHEAKAKKRGEISANVAIVRTITRQTRTKKKKELREKEEDQRRDGGSLLQGGVPQDGLKEEAQRYMQYAAFLHGQKDALVRLGNEALEDARRQPSDGNGDEDERRAAAQRLYSYVLGVGNSEASVDVEILRSMPSSMDRALKLYELAGERGSTEGWYNYGHLLWGIAQSNQVVEDDSGRGKKGSKADDLLHSLHAFRNAMELGDGDAAYFLGVQYLSSEEDEGLSKYLVELENCETLLDLKKYGFKLIQRAGNKYSHGGALYYTALVYRNGEKELGISPCSTEEFPQYLDQAANYGDADALFLRAYCLYNGEDGYSQDYSKALKGFIASGEAGNADGFVSAGAMLHRGGYGTAVQQDQRRAFEFYQEAAEMDSKEAWRNLVACYALGEGIPKCEQTSQYIAKTMLNDDSDDQ